MASERKRGSERERERGRRGRPFRNYHFLKQGGGGGGPPRGTPIVVRSGRSGSGESERALGLPASAHSAAEWREVYLKVIGTLLRNIKTIICLSAG